MANNKAYVLSTFEAVAWEWLCDEYPLGTFFYRRDIMACPVFNGLAEKTKQDYVGILIQHWINNSCGHFKKVGHRFTFPKA